MVSDTDKDAIRRHVEEIFEAYINKDRDALRSHHSENWIGYTLNSRTAFVGIEQYMQNAERILGSFDFKGYEIIEFNVTTFGHTAAVPYSARLWGSGNGQEFEIKIRVLDVYVNSDGAWNQVASNVSFHPQTIDAIIKSV